MQTNQAIYTVNANRHSPVSRLMLAATLVALALQSDVA